jgi:hypothetical protein
VSSVSLTTDGAEQLGRTLDAAGDALTDLTQVNRALGQEALTAAQIPVWTGQLERSSFVDATAQGFALSASAPYAGFVHASNPFFTRAIDARADRILDGLVDHADTVLDTIKGA